MSYYNPRELISNDGGFHMVCPFVSKQVNRFAHITKDIDLFLTLLCVVGVGTESQPLSAIAYGHPTRTF